MLTLLLGRAGSGKTGAVMQRLCAAAPQKPQILIVPEQQSHEAERLLCRVGGERISLYAEVLSFSRLANRIFLDAGGLGEPELDAGGRILLMCNAVKAAQPVLSAFAATARQPRFLQRMLLTVDELKSSCITPDDLARVGAEAAGPEGEKLRELAVIYSGYDALTAQVAFDPRDRLTRAAEKLAGSGVAAGRDFWLDGFTDFTAQQTELVRLLLAQGAQVTVTLTCDAPDGEDEIFAPARQTAHRLRALAKKEGRPCRVELRPPAHGVRRDALEHMEGALFGAQTPPAVPAQGAVELFGALTMRSEVEWTAARILRLVREQGLRFREIAVAARDFGAYRHLIESVFPRYGVPVFCAQMSDVLDKPVLALVTGALETVAGGYAYEDVFRYLKTGLTDLETEERDLLENYVLKWDLFGGRWTQQRDWTMHPRGYGAPVREEDKALLARINAARRRVVQPLETLRKNREKTGEGQARALYDFLERIGLPERLSGRVAQLRERGEPALADEYRQLWEILCTALEQCAALLGETPMELDEFSALFSLVLSQYDVGSIPVSLDRVSAGETTRQTGRRVRALFFLGAEDASVPMVTPEAGLLSDDDRSLLALYGHEAGQTGRDRLQREMTTVYTTCTRPEELLVVSWPRRGPGGEERRACFLVERLRLLFDDLTEEVEEALDGAFRLSAPLPALEQAGCSRTARRALGTLPEYADAVARLDLAAGWERGSLSRPAVDSLYGRTVPMSASRMDKYKSCHFSYFMRYGLRAEPRGTAGFSAPEYGTFVHYVLERVLAQSQDILAPAQQGEDGAGMPDALRDLLHARIDRAVEDYVREELGGLEEQTSRFRYLFRRLLRAVYAVVENAVEELRASEFRPLAFELGFGRLGETEPVELTAGDVTVSVSGLVDRVDGWVHDGRLYMRVVDYKTGRKSFDLTEVFSGMGLQMLLYLFTLKERGAQLYDMPVEPAGVLYIPARDVIVQGSRSMTDEQWRRALDKELCRKGVLLDDPAVLDAMERPQAGGYRFLPLRVSKTTGEVSGTALADAAQLGKLQTHVQRILADICTELAAGNIAADPFWRGPEKNACRYCDYTDACHFEEGRGGDCRRWLETLKPDEFWQKLDEEDAT